MKKLLFWGGSEAQYDLGVCYYNGEGVAQSYKKAVEWFKKAALLRCSEAQYALGMCYEIGRGVTKDCEIALMWYQKAADQGHEDAKFGINYGQCSINQEELKPIRTTKMISRMMIA